jgi:hypothetical protein
MSEYEMPEWVLKAAQEASAYARQMAPILKAVKEASDIVRLPRDAQRQIDEVRAAMAAIGPLPIPPPELMQVMNVGMRDLLAAFRHQHDVSVHVPAASAIGTAHPGVVFVTDTDVVRVTDDATVAVYDSRSPAVQLDAMTVFLAILWVLTVSLPPIVVLELPVTAQSIIAGYIAAVGLTLIIH